MRERVLPPETTLSSPVWMLNQDPFSQLSSASPSMPLSTFKRLYHRCSPLAIVRIVLWRASPSVYLIKTFLKTANFSLHFCNNGIFPRGPGQTAANPSLLLIGRPVPIDNSSAGSCSSPFNEACSL